MDIYVKGRPYRRGTKIRVINLENNKGDKDLNGKIGKLTTPFPEIPFGVVGIYIKTKNDVVIKANLAANEFEEVEELIYE